MPGDQPYAGPDRRRSERRNLDIDDDLDGAIGRLAAFRRRWNAGDFIDKTSLLTADDVDLILARLNWPQLDPGTPREGGE